MLAHPLAMADLEDRESFRYRNDNGHGNAVTASDALVHLSPQSDRPSTALLDPAFDPDQTISTQFDRFIDLASSRTLARLRLETPKTDVTHMSRVPFADSVVASPESSDPDPHHRHNTAISPLDGTSSWLANRGQHISRLYQPLSSRPSSLFRRLSVGKQSSESDSRSPISPSTVPSSSKSVSLYPTHPPQPPPYPRDSPHTPSGFTGSLSRLRNPAQPASVSPIPHTLNTTTIPSRSYHTSRSSNSDTFSVTERDDNPRSEAPDIEFRPRTRRPSADYKIDYSVRREIQDIKDRIDKLAFDSHPGSRSVAAMPTGPPRPEFRHDRQRSISVAPSAIMAGLTSPRRQFRNLYLPSVSPERVGSSAGFPPNAQPASPGGQYPLLHDALSRAKEMLQPSLYRALETMAGDALDLVSMTSDMSGPPQHAGMSVITTSAGSSERQICRKAESLCRSVTELAISMCQDPSGALPSLVRLPDATFSQMMPGHNASAVPMRRMREETPEPTIQQVEVSRGASSSDDPPRATTSRALDRIEARRTSLYQPPSTVTTPVTGRTTFPHRSSAATSALNSPSGPSEFPSSSGMPGLTRVVTTDISQGSGSAFLRRHRPPPSADNSPLNLNSYVPDRPLETAPAPPVTRSFAPSSQPGTWSRYSSSPYTSRQSALDLNGPSLTSAGSTAPAPRPTNSYTPSVHESMKSPPSAIASLKLRTRLSSNLPTRAISLSTPSREKEDSAPNSSRRSYAPAKSSADTGGIGTTQSQRYSVPAGGSRYSHFSELKSNNTGMRSGSTYSSTGPRPHSISYGNRAATMSSSSGSSSPPSSTAVASATTADTSRSIMLTPPRATKRDMSGAGTGGSVAGLSLSSKVSNYLPRAGTSVVDHSTERTSRLSSLPPSSMFRSKFGVPSSRPFQPVGAHKAPTSLFSGVNSSR